MWPAPFSEHPLTFPLNESRSEYFKLVSSVHGMRQCSFCLYREMRELLASLKFTPTEVDSRVFIGLNVHRQVIILCVEDIFLMSRTKEATLSFSEKLGQQLEIKHRPSTCFWERLRFPQTVCFSIKLNTSTTSEYLINCREAKSALDRSIQRPDDTARN